MEQLLPWERQPGEPPKAHRAFLVYLDMEENLRSLDASYAAWSQCRAGGEATVAPRERHKSAPGHWRAWCRRWNWVSRLEAREAHRQQLKHKAEDARDIQLVERRRSLEVRGQDVIEEVLQILLEKLREIRKLPNIDVEEKKFDADGRVTVHRKVRAMRPDQLAHLADEILEVQSRGVHGHIPVRKTLREDNAPAEASGEIALARFIPSPPPEEPARHE